MPVILIVVAYLIFENTRPSHAYILLNNFILSDFQKTRETRTCTLLVEYKKSINHHPLIGRMEGIDKASNPGLL